MRIYRVDVGLGDLRLPAIDVAADDLATAAILGRNLLNKLLIILDGPNQSIEIPE